MAELEKFKLKDTGTFLKEVFAQWNKDRATRMGASLAYYTIFSIPPLLIIAIAVAGFVFGQDAAEGRIVREIQGYLGKDGALAVQGMIQSARKPDASIIATIIGIVTLMIGATGVFVQLQDSLNSIWGVEPKPDRSWMDSIKERLGSFSMIIGTGFLLMASLLIDAILSAFTDLLGRYFDSMASVYLLKITNFGVSFLIITTLFAMIYKVLPDVKIDWKDVGLGAVVTSTLFIIGKFLIGMYLGRSNVGAAYGAAGSIIVMLTWIYYASLIFIFGAEFTQIYTKKYGHKIQTIHGSIVVDASKHRCPDKKTIDPETQKKQKLKDQEKKKELVAIPMQLKSDMESIAKPEEKKEKSPALTIGMVFLRLFLSKYRNKNAN